MANELLDFVLALVRDPGAAARYAADPVQAINDAHLIGVTSADVNSLLPVVSDSWALSAPALGAAGSSAGNVWTSGAATAALDAFTPHHTTTGESVPHQATVVIAAPVLSPNTGAVSAISDKESTLDVSSQLSGVEAGSSALGDNIEGDPSWYAWEHGIADSGFPHGVHHGFGVGHHGPEMLD